MKAANPEKSLAGAAVDGDEQWISVSDLMSALMLIFLLIAILFMWKIENEKRQIEDANARIEKIAVTYQELQIALYEELLQEFSNDLKQWHAEIDPDLTVRFREPEILFDSGESSIKLRFKEILDSFFPRYVKILTSDRYRDDIVEVRIEGHTSSVWTTSVSGDDAYIHNMRLSQERTRSVLNYVLSMPRLQTVKAWLKSKVTANGLSSSRLVFDEKGQEDDERSRRVEFRVITDAERRIVQIIRDIEEDD